MTLICVPIVVKSSVQVLAEASLAAEHGADLVELRIDGFFHGSQESTEQTRTAITQLIADSPLPSIVTCRHSSEGGNTSQDHPEPSAEELLDLFEHLAAQPRPPRYIDIELARVKPVQHRLQALAQRGMGVIVSMHDFTGRPDDLTRRLSAAYELPCASVVKVAFRARSLRDNLELFEILRHARKPTIALGMGEFGLMSRVLAPKFGGLLTFAALRSTSTTAPGQPTLRELIHLYRFRSIGPHTRVYGVIGWPVTQSLSPLIHNAGFDAIGHDGVYLPLPVAADEKDPLASFASFKATVTQLWDDEQVHFSGASVTIPHKSNALELGEGDINNNLTTSTIGAANTLVRTDIDSHSRCMLANTDAPAIIDLLHEALGNLAGKQIAVVGAGGAARAAAIVCAAAGMQVIICNRTVSRAVELAAELNQLLSIPSQPDSVRPHKNGPLQSCSLSGLADTSCDVYINCTPVGMVNGPDPAGMSIPVRDLANRLPRSTIFFDTVYNPMLTPMLKAAQEHRFAIIDGVQMFVHQAEAQFSLWTRSSAPQGLFDRLVRAQLLPPT